MNLEEKATNLINDELERIKVEIIARSLVRIDRHEFEIKNERDYIQKVIDETKLRWNSDTREWELGR